MYFDAKAITQLISDEAAAAKAEGDDALSVLNAACAEYYEVETFVLADALAAAAAPVAAAVIETPATPGTASGTAGS